MNLFKITQAKILPAMQRSDILQELLQILFCPCYFFVLFLRDVQWTHSQKLVELLQSPK